MPPSPAYNWFCVLYSAANILSHAAQYRSSQVLPKAGLRAGGVAAKRRRATASEDELQGAIHSYNEEYSDITLGIEIDVGASEPVKSYSEVSQVGPSLPPQEKLPYAPVLDDNCVDSPTFRRHEVAVEDVKPITSSSTPESTTQAYTVPPRSLQSSKVPSSRIGRLFHYGGLAASLGYGVASELLRRAGSENTDSQSSVIMTEANVKRLVSKLSQMRGAALKLGQFMSIQDTHTLPADVDRIFRRVQDSAHYMPDWQMEKVMTSSLGPDWMSNFVSFDRIPFAAASIGQVHKAVLSPSISPTGRAEPVAVKIQFPNIKNSITSDLGYIKLLLTASQLLPKGLFLDKTIKVMSEELADECDYTREASFLRKFGSPKYLGNDPRFKIPWVWEGSTSAVLVMERVDGVTVGEADASQFNQEDRNDIASWVLELCLKELFEFRTMQTDPNWSNFLWNRDTRQIELVDFGASREYSTEFMDNWLHLLQSAALEDRQACIEWSLKLGYLTGEENEIMLDAHVNSMVLLATPFRSSTHQPFSFGIGSRWTGITAEIRAQIPVMLRHRLTPPPRETYSLNRKLSGAFLLAARLGATIETKTIWDKVVNKYQFST
ncbi:hypothetical protein AMATHDRAFT_77645 [Amanita thiersii Skay4041]|uniref:ABC1 atypical kinase-like domain-containing protein n=1 Tax=Amanita thiersii Skay4041 TaxID=703135 RepID=A0A2A9NE24_9AGAR|nr:hypothetical protein AMATHDRAFT_77645 [Amanita thiersii Skay4041]